MYKSKFFAVTFSNGWTGIYSARNREELSTIFRSQQTPGTQMYSYDAIEVVFPPAPKPITRPDWTRKIGSVWKVPTVADAIYMLVDENTIMAFNYGSKRPLTFSVWDDNSEIWGDVRKLE